MSSKPSRTSAKAPRLVHLEQAIFTSRRSARSDGYHLVAQSAGIRPSDRRALVQWGPSHDALLAGASRSVNFFPMPERRFSLSVTMAGEAEHSHRGGICCYTQYWVGSMDVLSAVNGHPWRLLDAAEQAGILQVRESLPESLSPQRFSLDEDPPCTERDVPEDLLPELYTHRCALIDVEDPELIVRAIINGLSPSQRLACSFTTALRYSPTRPFKLMCLPDDQRLCRQLTRDGIRLVEFSACP